MDEKKINKAECEVYVKGDIYCYDTGSKASIAVEQLDFLDDGNSVFIRKYKFLFLLYLIS